MAVKPLTPTGCNEGDVLTWNVQLIRKVLNTLQLSFNEGRESCQIVWDYITPLRWLAIGDISQHIGMLMEKNREVRENDLREMQKGLKENFTTLGK